MHNHNPLRTQLLALGIVCLMAMTALSTGQATDVPPSPSSLEDSIDEALDGADETLAANDPTNGLVPSINSLRMNSNVAALTDKLDAYQAALLSGAIAKVPSGEVDFDDVDIQEGFLPNRTLVTGLDLLSTLGINQLLEEPLPCAEVSPEGGLPSQSFTFDASCSVDAQTATRDLEARWDWEGDGTYDTTWSGTLAASHSYGSVGERDAVVEVRDEDGNTATATVGVHVSNPPNPCFSVSPSSGTTATVFFVEASCSSDDLTSSPSLQVRWDWENDGTWDTSWTTIKSASHQYSGTGTKIIKLEVRDEIELSATTTKSVTVSRSGDGGGDGGDVGGGDASPRPAYTSQSSSSTPLVPFAEMLDELLDQGTPVTDVVLYQRMPNAPYEPAQPGEAWHVDGRALHLQPAAVPVSALVDMEWLEEAFGTYGSPDEFTVVYHDGRPHALIDDRATLSGAIEAFTPIALGQSTNLFTTGHPDMVEAEDRAMRISFPSYPEWRHVEGVRQDGGNTTTDERNVYQDRLGIHFDGADHTGQTVFVNKTWLDGLGITQPRFVHDDGSAVNHTLVDGRYVLEPEHFSTIYAENFDDGAAQGWTMTGLWRVANNACTTSHSGSYHIAYNKASTCNYDTGSTNSGYAYFDRSLSGYTSPALSFYHKWSTESYTGAYDQMRVSISSNGGSSWTQLGYWDSKVANQGSWKHQSYDLSAYVGQTVRVKFEFKTIDSIANNYLGWAIDSVTLTGSTSDAPPTPCFGRTPSSGTTTTTFHFDAYCSTDAEDPTSSLQVRWDWQDDGEYDTVYSTNKEFDHKFTSTGTHTVRMMVRDTKGQTASTAGSVTVSQASTGGEGLSSTFESGTDAWSLGGMWHRTSCRAGAGTYSIVYNQGSCSNADYDNGATNTGSATSPSFKLPANLPSLSFKSWFETEGGPQWDRKYVEISTNGGSTWTMLKQINDGQRVWSNHVIALDSYAGKTVSIRFRFDSVDGVANQYEGWYIDEVKVAFNDAVVRSDGEFLHSYMEARSYQWYYRHDKSPEAVWRIGDTTDSVRQRFYMSQAPETGEYAYVYVYAKSVSCTSTPTLELLVNGQTVTQVSTCGWSSSNYGWKAMSIPSNLLKAGNNDVTLRGTCSCSAAIDMQTDSSGSGTYTDLVVNGQTRNGYEAFWYLIVGRPSEYETLERYSTYEYTDANGVRQMEHIQEAYVFNDLEQMDTTYLMQRTLADGRKVYFASNMEFLKRDDYTSQTKYSGWQHWVFDPDGMDAPNQGRETPTTNQFYTWFRYDWQYLIPNEDGTAYQSSKGSFIQLVESNPSDPADKQGPDQNPPAYGSSGLNFDVHGEYYIKTCEYSSHKHTPWDPSSHPHDCYRFAITLLDLDQNTKEHAKALNAVNYIMNNWVNPIIQNADMTDWLQKSMKSSLKGSMVGWFMSVAQTGDALSLNMNERDHKILFTDKYSPWTVASTVPTIPGWVFPFDPHTVGHILLWNGKFDLSGQWP